MGESASPATAARLTRWWARLYTVGLPREQRDRRLAELESDLWESLADRAGAREIVERTVGERRTPVVVIHYIEEHLIRNGRLDEAAALMLRDPDDYPLAPQLLDALATALIDERGEAAAIDFLTRILDAFPDDETARRILMELGGEPSANAQQPEGSAILGGSPALAGQNGSSRSEPGTVSAARHRARGYSYRNASIGAVFDARRAGR